MVYWYYVTLLGNFIVQCVQKEVQPIENARLLVNYKKRTLFSVLAIMLALKHTR